MSSHHDAGQFLKDATKTLYKKYGKVKGRRGWADMNEAMDHAAETKLCAQLTQPEYDHLSWHAMCWANDDPDTVRYFLPRMFEDMATDVETEVSDEMVIHSLNKSQWRIWPHDEITLIEDWFSAWWTAVLCFPALQPAPNGSLRLGFPHYRCASNCLKLIAFAGMEMKPFLDTWQERTSFEAIAQLVDFLIDLDGYLSAGEMHGWVKVWGSDGVDSERRDIVLKWLQSHQVAEKLEDAFFRPEFTSIATDISSALAFASRNLPYRTP